MIGIETFNFCAPPKESSDNLKDPPKSKIYACKKLRKAKNLKLHEVVGELMTIRESHIDLQMVMEFFGVNLFSNLLLLRNSTQLEQFKPCIKNGLDGYEIWQDDWDYLFPIQTLKMSSVNVQCKNISLNPICKRYCEWQANVSSKISVQEIRTITRYIKQSKNT